MPASNCKGCRASVRVTEQEVDRALEKLAESGVGVAPEGTILARWAVCGRCEALQYGTTCRFCGGLARIRAAIAALDCPAPTGSRWR